MEVTPQLFIAKVMHKRLFPKVNSFTYGVYYLALPLSQLYQPITTGHFPINKPGILSFYEKDHGARLGSIEEWVRKILMDHSLNESIKEIMLISMPRVLGYVFNPVSFYLCLDKEAQLRAVLCEVNNTFGETHSYLCSHEGGTIIEGEDWLEAKKLFHVSPFLKREGHYKFRFSLKEDKLGIWIDFYNAEDKKQLITSLIGNLHALTKSNVRKVFFKHPLVTLKTILLIHWQAIKLFIKGIRYISKPKQLAPKFSTTYNIKKI